MDSANFYSKFLHPISLIQIQLIYKHQLNIIQEQMVICKCIRFQTQHLFIVKNYFNLVLKLPKGSISNSDGYKSPCGQLFLRIEFSFVNSFSKGSGNLK